MKARDYNSVLMKIRTDTKRFGNDTIVVSRVTITSVEFHHLNWKRKVECSVEGLIQLTKVGFFIVADKDEYSAFLAQKKDNIELTLNKTLLIKKNKAGSMLSNLPSVFLIGGILSLLISILLFMTDSQTSGFVSYSISGNSLMNSENSMNWFHVFIIGIGLILLFLIGRLFKRLK